MVEQHVIGAHKFVGVDHDSLVRALIGRRGDHELVVLLLPVAVEIDVLVQTLPGEHLPVHEQQFLLLPAADLIGIAVTQGAFPQGKSIVDPPEVGVGRLLVGEGGIGHPQLAIGEVPAQIGSLSGLPGALYVEFARVGDLVEAFVGRTVVEPLRERRSELQASLLRTFHEHPPQIVVEAAGLQRVGFQCPEPVLFPFAVHAQFPTGQGIEGLGQSRLGAEEVAASAGAFGAQVVGLQVEVPAGPPQRPLPKLAATFVGVGAPQTIELIRGRHAERVVVQAETALPQMFGGPFGAAQVPVACKFRVAIGVKGVKVFLSILVLEVRL